jgi:hypothetical protein
MTAVGRPGRWGRPCRGESTVRRRVDLAAVMSHPWRLRATAPPAPEYRRAVVPAAAPIRLQAKGPGRGHCEHAGPLARMFESAGSIIVRYLGPPPGPYRSVPTPDDLSRSKPSGARPVADRNRYLPIWAVPMPSAADPSCSPTIPAAPRRFQPIPADRADPLPDPCRSRASREQFGGDAVAEEAATLCEP